MPIRNPGRSRAAPLLWALAALVGILCLVLYLVLGLQLREAHREWTAGRAGAAAGTLREWSRYRMRAADYDEALAVVLLSAGKKAEARPHLDRVSGRRPGWFPTFSKEEVAARLVGSGRYEEFLLYDRSVHHRRESREVDLYRVAALVGRGSLDEAFSAFAGIPADEVDRARYDRLRRALDERRQGKFALVVDRDGKSLADYHIQNRDLVAVNRDFAPLIEAEAGSLTIESHLGEIGTAATVETTLDPFVQKAALAALGNLRGSIVAIDPATNEILAIASSHPYGQMSNLALEGAYEPGSVIKVLTALKAAESGFDFSKVFPFVCKGLLEIDGRRFMDWAVHGDLPNLRDALAVSCNTAFAEIGLRVGREPMLAFLHAAGFDGELDLGILRVPMGKTVGSFDDRFEIANLAVGLEHETINALHLAMIGSMIANGGELVTPVLLRGRRSVLGDAVGAPVARKRTRVVSAAAVERILPAMEAVVLDPRGTGRRVKIPGLTIALKTGTAGDRENGYNSLIVAFAPVERPRIVFGMIAEDSGPADLLGARVAHDFLTGLAPRLK